MTCGHCSRPFVGRKPSSRFCSRACFYGSHRTTLSCEHCRQTFTVKNTVAARRRFCSKRCQAAALLKPSTEARSRGGLKGAETRFGWFWKQAMQKCQHLTPMEAFAWGYKLGYHRKARKVARERQRAA